MWPDAFCWTDSQDSHVDHDQAIAPFPDSLSHRSEHATTMTVVEKVEHALGIDDSKPGIFFASLSLCFNCLISLAIANIFLI